MVQVPKAELLAAMKVCLHDLEELNLFNPDDLNIVGEKRMLRQKIAKLEDKGSSS
jgi:hypothetical protein